MHIACAFLLLVASTELPAPTEDVVVVDILATCTPSDAAPGAYQGAVLEAANDFSSIFVGGHWSLTPSARGWPKSDEDAEALLWHRFFSYEPGDPSWVAEVSYEFAVQDTNGDAVYASARAYAILLDTDHDSLAEDSDFSEVEISCILDPPSGTGVYSIIGDYPAQTGGLAEFSLEDTSPWWIHQENPEGRKFPATTAIRIYWRQPPTAVEPTTWASIKSLYR
jgi:hypothetical protein